MVDMIQSDSDAESVVDDDTVEGVGTVRDSGVDVWISLVHMGHGWMFACNGTSVPPAVNMGSRVHGGSEIGTCDSGNLVYVHRPAHKVDSLQGSTGYRRDKQ